jgi:hypothetical protein
VFYSGTCFCTPDIHLFSYQAKFLFINFDFLDHSILIHRLFTQKKKKNLPNFFLAIDINIWVYIIGFEEIMSRTRTKIVKDLFLVLKSTFEIVKLRSKEVK